MNTDDIVARYRAGEHLRQIGAAAGLTHEAVRKRLLKAGVELRPRARPRKPLDTQGHLQEWFGVSRPAARALARMLNGAMPHLRTGIPAELREAMCPDALHSTADGYRLTEAGLRECIEALAQQVAA